MTERTNITRSNFFAWSLYTAYRNIDEIGNWVAAEWPGKKITNAQDMQDDIDFRIDMLIEALKITIEAGKDCNNDEMRYFVVPEFYFHSAHGPYPGLNINDESAFEYIMSQLSVRIKSTLADSSEAKKDWVICTGGVLTTHIEDIESFLAGAEVQKRLTKLNDIYTRVIEQNPKRLEIKHIGLMRLKALESSCKQGVTSKGDWDEFNQLVNAYRQDPLCTVRNRAGIFVYNGSSTGEIIDYSVEKQAESTVDLTIGVTVVENGNKSRIDTGGQITEWMANYPPINITGGDNQNPGNKAGARLTIGPQDKKVELGVEICLDHRLRRLRRNVNMEGNSPIDIQLVASGGMQLLDYAIAAGSSGAIFNADGCGDLLSNYDNPNDKAIIGNGKDRKVITGVYTLSAQTCSEGTDREQHYSHSQLAYRTDEGGPSDYINPQGIKNAGGSTNIGTEENPSNQYLDLYSLPTIIPVENAAPKKIINRYFTAGLGEIHQYSISTPT